MLRFRMKMLSKENLMARTSDIGSCLGLLAGKILIVGFVVATVFGSNVLDSDINQKTGKGYSRVAVLTNKEKIRFQENKLFSQPNYFKDKLQTTCD